MSVDVVPCAECEAVLPEYLMAYLRGAPVRSLYPAFYNHLRDSAACAATAAEVLRLLRQREAAVPFNAEALPVTLMVRPTREAGGHCHAD